MPKRKSPVLHVHLDQSARRSALVALLEARNVADEVGRDAWSFACQLPALHRLGVSDTDLRWLVEYALIEHRLETTRGNGRRRTFRACRSTRFTAASCFVLTAAGVLAARQEAAAREARLCPAQPLQRPHFDNVRRALVVDDTVVKRFKVPARNQELILAAFEEEGWPTHVDDPLPPVRSMDSAKRLLDAIYRLNHRQRPRLIVFEGDGNGTGITWRLIDGQST